MDSDAGNQHSETPVGRQDRSQGSHTSATAGEPSAGEPTAGEPTVREPTGPGDDLAFGIYVSCWGDRWHVRVSGKVDPAGAAAVLDVAEVLAARAVPSVDLDFSEVTEIDAAGWRAALYAESVLAASVGGCRLIGPPSTLLHPSRLAPPHADHAA